MSQNELIFCTITAVTSTLVNLTITKKTLKDLSKEDPWLGPLFTFFPVLSTLAIMACFWIRLERKASV